jgi:hypothetical protein
VIQHSASRLFPAASIVIIAAWLLDALAGMQMPPEVSAALVGIIGWVATYLKLSRTEPVSEVDEHAVGSVIPDEPLLDVPGTPIEAAQAIKKRRTRRPRRG